MPPIQPLTEDTLLLAVREVTAADPLLASILDRHGPPPLWQRPPGFGTLLYIILEQQVSLASARAAYLKLTQAIEPLTPAAFLTLSDVELKTIGFSRQKTHYGRGLAAAVLEGSLDLEALPDLPDESVRAELVKIKGIGPWTANIYLLMVLCRPDVWPGGDLALAVAWKKLNGLDKPPSTDELAQISLRWQPWRAAAARLLWHYYLSQPAAKKA